MPETRAKLRVDPSAVAATTSTPSPSTASTTFSPLTTRPTSPSSQTTEEEEEEKRATTKSDGEKPKRCRVTPEQLVHLERFFAAERSPTASRRREISELLGMQERQTQIWFQNRRAKAKLQSSKLKKGKDCNSPGSQVLPRLSMSFENELNNLIHEDEPVTFIPCSNLAIGSWRRVTTDSSQRDLVAYTCENKRCLTWFIHNGGFGFKMEMPMETIIHAEFTSMAPGPTGLASFALSRAPLFYLESISEDGFTRRWKRSTDWTEGRQATQVLRHDLIGNAASLAFLVQSLQANAEVSALSPYYQAEQPPSEVAIPPPPLSVIQPAEQPQQSPYADSHHESGLLLRPNLYRRRSFAAGNDLSHLDVTGLTRYGRDLPHTAPPASYTHTAQLPLTPNVPAPPPPIAEELVLEDYGVALGVLHEVTPAYAAQPVPRRIFEKPTPFLFNLSNDDESWSPGMDSSQVAQMYHMKDNNELGLCFS